MGSDKYRKRSISLEGRKDVLEEVFGGERELRALISSTWPQRSHLSPLRMIRIIHFINWRRKWQPTPVLLPGESHGGRSLVGYSLWGHKESDSTERLHFTLYAK